MKYMDELQTGLTDRGGKRHFPAIKGAIFPTRSLCGRRLTATVAPDSFLVHVITLCKRCKRDWKYQIA